jgi:hypothetical protein
MAVRPCALRRKHVYDRKATVLTGEIDLYQELSGSPPPRVQEEELEDPLLEELKSLRREVFTWQGNSVLIWQFSNCLGRPHAPFRPPPIRRLVASRASHLPAALPGGHQVARDQRPHHRRRALRHPKTGHQGSHRCAISSTLALSVLRCIISRILMTCFRLLGVALTSLCCPLQPCLPFDCPRRHLPTSSFSLHRRFLHRCGSGHAHYRRRRHSVQV